MLAIASGVLRAFRIRHFVIAIRAQALSTACTAERAFANRPQQLQKGATASTIRPAASC